MRLAYFLMVGKFPDLLGWHPVTVFSLTEWMHLKESLAASGFYGLADKSVELQAGVSVTITTQAEEDASLPGTYRLIKQVAEIT